MNLKWGISWLQNFILFKEKDLLSKGKIELFDTREVSARVVSKGIKTFFGYIGTPIKTNGKKLEIRKISNDLTNHRFNMAIINLLLAKKNYTQNSELVLFEY